MEQINKVELRGVVGNVRIQTFSDRKMAKFTVVTNYAYKDRNNNPVIETTWHPVVMWEGKGLPDPESIAKGIRVYVAGRVRIQKYMTSDDVEKLSYEVVAARVTILDDQEPMQFEF